VVDVGAHIGRFSLAAARAGASVVAVEPNPETFSVLAVNVGLNGFRNVRLVNAEKGIKRLQQHQGDTRWFLR